MCITTVPKAQHSKHRATTKANAGTNWKVKRNSPRTIVPNQHAEQRHTEQICERPGERRNAYKKGEKKGERARERRQANGRAANQRPNDTRTEK
jgi:hypothetical protein